jgi:uncharacterized alkaline shock family protein YloU
MAEKRIEITDENGRITMAEEVITAIARIAAERVAGIARSSGGAGGGEDIAPAVKIELANDQARIELRISVEYGYAVHAVARGVQENVEVDVERLAGVAVSSVDVYVKKVVPPQTHDSGAS